MPKPETTPNHPDLLERIERVERALVALADRGRTFATTDHHRALASLLGPAKEAAAVRQAAAQLERDRRKAAEAEARMRDYKAAVARGRLVGDDLPEVLAQALAAEHVCIELGKLLAPLRTDWRGVVLLALHETSTRPGSLRGTAAAILSRVLVDAASAGARVMGGVDGGASFDGDDLRPLLTPSRLTRTMTVDAPGGWELLVSFAALPAAWVARVFAHRLTWDDMGVSREQIASLHKLPDLAAGQLRCLYVGAPGWAGLEPIRGSAARLATLQRAGADASASPVEAA